LSLEIFPALISHWGKATAPGSGASGRVCRNGGDVLEQKMERAGGDTAARSVVNTLSDKSDSFFGEPALLASLYPTSSKRFE
jgi:hypothetical protein